MNLLKRVRSINFWIRRKTRGLAVRLLRKLTSSPGDLRQFVYLDEIALRSLMASRYGAEEVKQIESRSTSRDVGSNSTAQVGLPATMTLAGGKNSTSSKSRSLEVERQPTVQSMFAEFLQREREAGALVWDSTTGKTTHPKKVERGHLMQVKVRLAADPVYRINAIISEFSDMPQSFSQSGQLDMAQLAEVSNVLDRLMVGQIPIRAEVVGQGAQKDGAGYLIAGRENTSSCSLYIVASTDEDKYWTDTRRVLYGNQEFNVLVRVTADGPTNEWSPIKLFDMMRHFIPNISDTLGQFEDAIGNVPTQVSTDPSFVEALKVVFRKYSESIAPSASGPDLAIQVDALATEIAPMLPNATKLNEAFDKLDNWLDSYGDSVDPDRRRLAREEARLAGSLDVQGGSTRQHAVVNLPANHDVAFIEAEVIAIYW